MRMEGLFEIISVQREGEGHTFGVRLDAAHPLFEGHFPGMPVLPGVCSMYILKQCAGRAEGLELNYESVKECKFISAILPDSHSILDVSLVSHSTGEGKYSISATIGAGGQTMVKIKAVLNKA